MKVFCYIPKENWFCDRYGLEYKNYSNHDVSLKSIYKDTDVIWLLAAWCWNKIDPRILSSKKVVATIHHEVPWKFNEKRKLNFLARDQYVDHYHVPCEKTKKFIAKYTSKPIKVLSYWCNQNLFKEINRTAAKEKFNVPQDKFIISSFQRDTEGYDLKTPKLEKGPDIFIDYVKKVNNLKKNVHVLLNGWRRNYIINELKSIGIPFTYKELPPMGEVVEMYSATDLYIVGSRVEGGPQSIIECAMTNTPIVSTDVGIATKFLNNNCIFNPFDKDKEYNVYFPTKEDLEYSASKIKDYYIENHVKRYDSFFEEIA